MLINNNINSLASLYTSSMSAAAKPKTKPQQARSFQDEMLISNEAQTFKAMLNDLSNLKDVRQDKVDEFSQKIEAGTYDVKAENIAAKLIAMF